MFAANDVLPQNRIIDEFHTATGRSPEKIAQHHSWG
jgi:hypothetical protein